MRLGVGTTVEEAEKLLILKTLESTNNNKTQRRGNSGISLKTLHNKLKEYGSALAILSGKRSRPKGSRDHHAGFQEMLVKPIVSPSLIIT